MTRTSFTDKDAKSIAKALPAVEGGEWLVKVTREGQGIEVTGHDAANSARFAAWEMTIGATTPTLADIAEEAAAYLVPRLKRIVRNG